MKIKKYLLVIFLFLFSLPSVYYLLIPGFYEPHDLHHLADVYQMYKAFVSGQFPPRLGPNFIFNYGHPLFNFYYVLPFYLGSIFFAFLKNLQLSLKLVFIISFFLSSFGMYLFLREFFGRLPSLTGAILFLYSPYRAVQVYVRGAVGEALSLSLLPFVFWVITKLFKNPEKKSFIFLSSILFSLFILSHNYFWALSFPFLIFFTIIYSKNNLKERLFSLFKVSFFALLITGYWWFPALIEQRLLHSQTPFPLYDHFPFFKQLVFPSWGYGASVWGPDDGLSFQVGVVNWLVLLLGIFVFFIKKRDKIKFFRFFLWAFISFLIVIFFMNIRSYFLWRLIPFHNFVQFPWRLLAFTSFFTAFISSILLVWLKSFRFVLGIAVIAGSLFLTFNYFRPSQIFYKNDSEYLSRFFANLKEEKSGNKISNEYLNWSEDYLLLPLWVDEKPNSLPDEKISSNDALVKNIQKISEVRWKAIIYSSDGAMVSFNSFYFPGWFAKVDEESVEIQVGKPYGQIEVFIPKGEHEVYFYWAETPLRKIGDFLSLFSLIFLFIFYFPFKKNYERKGN